LSVFFLILTINYEKNPIPSDQSQTTIKKMMKWVHATAFSLLCGFGAIYQPAQATKPNKSPSCGVLLSEFATPIDAFKAWLRDPATKSEQIIEYLSRDPKLEKLYADPRGEVGFHSSKVLDMFENESRFYDLSTIQMPGATDVRSFMRMVIALHDIGKSISGREQHKYTVPILTESMRKLGWSAAEIRLARALVDNDYLGGFVSGRSGLSTLRTFEALVKQAKSSGIDVASFIRLQELLFICDAGSYGFFRHTRRSEGEPLKVENLAYQRIVATLKKGLTDDAGKYQLFHELYQGDDKVWIQATTRQEPDPIIFKVAINWTDFPAATKRYLIEKLDSANPAAEDLNLEFWKLLLKNGDPRLLPYLQRQHKRLENDPRRLRYFRWLQANRDKPMPLSPMPDELSRQVHLTYMDIEIKFKFSHSSR
jgi:hypothetical protein